MKPPFSSEFDPSEEAEGSVDPLGLQPAYERLADRLLPAVTVRMGRPRFVTAMAVGAYVCSDWGSDAVAADKITPAWLVWEWFLIEAFVRGDEQLSAKTNIPGIQKVQRALRNQRPVGASAYLKTPGTFGFTGVFRRLALKLGILTEDGRLDDSGYELVNAWATDQRLDEFIDGSVGEGPRRRDLFCRAIAQGMEKGHTTQQSKEFWQTLVQLFDPGRPGRNESRVLLTHILTRAGQPPIIDFLRESLIAQGGVSDREGEVTFLRKFRPRAPDDLKQLLTAIDAYEGLARTLTNAFDSLRNCASTNGGSSVSAAEFSASRNTRSALGALGPSLARVRNCSPLLEWESKHQRLEQTLHLFEKVRNGADLFNAVLEYHEQVQREKPPSGKRFWFERAPRGKVVVRAGYLLPELAGKPGYVHEYRIPTFSRFLKDLGALR